MQRSQEKYTSRSTALVASGQTFALAFSYTSERDEWIQLCNRKVLKRFSTNLKHPYTIVFGKLVVEGEYFADLVSSVLDSVAERIK